MVPLVEGTMKYEYRIQSPPINLLINNLFYITPF